jgi:tetratricopeptide (TPR) repeat protein
MKWTTTSALILVAGAGALWVNGLFTPEPEDPRKLLALLEAEETARGSFQPDALRRLSSAIEARGTLDDPALAQALFRARAGVYRSLGALGSARADLERVLETWAPGDWELELEISELMALDGQTDAALERIRKLISSAGPGAAQPQRAFELVGRFEATIAARRREQASELCREHLDERGGTRAIEIVSEVSARGTNDPRAAELLSELRGIFRPHESAPVTEVLDLIHQSSAATGAAVEAFARSAALAPTGAPIAEVARTLAIVGREDEATDLMLAARAVEEIARSAPAMAQTLQLLDRTGRMERVRGAWESWDWHWGGDLEFYRTSADLLLRAGMLASTSVAANGMAQVGGGLGAHWTRFFFSAVTIRSIASALAAIPTLEVPREQLELNSLMLTSYARNLAEPEPFPGARTDAWFLVATAARLLGNDEDERVALATGLPARSAAGADRWVRLAELEARGPLPAWERIEQRLTVALDQEPLRTSEFLDRWIEAGDRALQSDGLTLEHVVAEARLTADGRSLRRVGASVHWRVAEAHLREGRRGEARNVADRLLQEYPRLVPALDVQIEVQLTYPASAQLTEMILRRIELCGIDARTESFLERLPTALRGADLLRAMRAAPEHFGRHAAAQLALQSGDTERAAQLLEQLDAASTSPKLRLMRGQVRLRTGRLGPAGEDFDALLELGSDVGDAVLGALEVRVRQGDRAATEALLERATGTAIPTPRRLAMVDVLLDHQQLDLAQGILNQLDQSVESRTPEFYRALVRYATLTRDPATIEEAVARAGAYVQDGTPEIAELLLHIRARNWLALPEVAQRLRATGVALTPFEDSCLTLLEERIAQGRRLVERNTASQPKSAEWALVRAVVLALSGEPIELPVTFGAKAVAETTEVLVGTRSGRRDPRELLVVLLLLERQEWWPWIEQELRQIDEQRTGRLWSSWLWAELLRRQGEDTLSGARIDALLTEYNDFEPAWDRRLQALSTQHATDPLARPLLEARVARLAALGEATLEDAIEIALARASAEALAGSDQKAIFELGRTVTRERRGDFAARFTLGALLVRFGQHGLAVDHLREAAASAPPEAAGALADALVDAILHAANPAIEQRAPIAPADLPARLDEVVRLFPTDPIVSSVWVRHGADVVQGTTQGTTAAVISQRATRARLELNRLRRESRQQSLEVMRRGSTAAWVALTLEVAPELARELVDFELERRPGDVALWELAASITDEFGEHAAAESLYRTVLAVDARASACLALAERLVRRGAPENEIMPILEHAGRLLEGRQTARSRVLLVDLRMRAPYPDFPFVTGELGAIWNQRATPDGTVSLTRVGFALVAAHLQRCEDLARQRALLASQPPLENTPPVVLPTEAELAGKALAVLVDLEPMVRGDLHLASLVECYRGIATSLVGAHER